MEQFNRLIERLTETERMGMELVNLLVVRPSQDLGRLSREYEPRLPRTFRFLTRGLGTRDTRSPDMLSMLMFQSDYIGRLMEMGEADADAHADELAVFMSPVLPTNPARLRPKSVGAAPKYPPRGDPGSVEGRAKTR